MKRLTMLMLMVLAALAVFAAPAVAELADYAPNDVAVINAMIDGNELIANKNQPDEWGFADWTEPQNDGLKHLFGLSLPDKGLTGEISLTSCEYLDHFDIADNPDIAALVLTGSPNLTGIDCSGTDITTASFGNLSKLAYLNVTDTSISGELDLRNIATLTSVVCENTSISSIRLDSASVLENLSISNCRQLLSVTLSDRGVSISANDATMGSICIGFVDISNASVGLVAMPNVHYTFDKWTGLVDCGDESSSFAISSLAAESYITCTADFQAGEADLGNYDPTEVAAINSMIANNGLNASYNTPDHWWFIEWNRDDEVYHITNMDLSWNGLYGALDFTALSQIVDLNLDYNNISSIDVVNIENSLLFLRSLRVESNRLVNLDLTDLSNLEELYVDHNRLTELDVHTCNALNTLSASGNVFDTLNISDLEYLNYVTLYDCGISSLMVQGRTFSADATLDGAAYVHMLNLSDNDMEVQAEIATDNSVFSGWTAGWTGEPEIIDPLRSTLRTNMPASGDVTVTANYIAKTTPDFDQADITALTAFVNAVGWTDKVVISDPSTWLDFARCAYDTTKEKLVISHLWLNERGLSGALDLSGFKNLRSLDIARNKLTAANLNGLSLLADADFDGNSELSSLILTDCSSLEALLINETAIRSLDLSAADSFKTLYADGCNISNLSWANGSIALSGEGGMPYVEYYDQPHRVFNIMANPNEGKQFAGWSGLPDMSLWLYEYIDGIALEDGVDYDISATYIDDGGRWQSDVDFINGLIDTNGLGAEKNNPDSWNFAEWESAHLTNLRLEGYGLYGDIDFSACTTLRGLELQNNNLSSVTVKNLPELESINVDSNNALEYITLENLPMLNSLDLNYTRVSQLNPDIVARLVHLGCCNTFIDELDFSQSTVVRSVDCENTRITKLDLSKTENLKWFSIYGIPKFSELRLSDRYIKLNADSAMGSARIRDYYTDGVDDTAELCAIPNAGYTFTGWTGLPEGYDPSIARQGVTVASGSGLNITANFAAGDPDVGDYSLGDMQVINRMIAENCLDMEPSKPDTWDDIVDWDRDDNNLPYRITGVHIDNREVTGGIDITGLDRLEYFTANNNKITDVNLRSMQSLNRVELVNNRLTALDLTGLTNLQLLSVNENSISGLDFTYCLALETLYVNNNKSIDISGIASLDSMKYLSCYGSDLTSVEMRGRTLTAEANPQDAGFASVQEVRIDGVNDTVRMEADAYGGYTFSGWSGVTGISDLRRPYIVLPADGDVTATANFRADNGNYLASDVAAMAEFIEAIGWQGRVDVDKPQDWGWFVDWAYEGPDSVNQVISGLHLDGQGLSGDIDLSRFQNLRTVSITSSLIASLTIENLPKLIKVDANDNSSLSSLSLAYCDALEELDISRSTIDTLNLQDASGLNILNAYDSGLSNLTTSDCSVSLYGGGSMGWTNIQTYSRANNSIDLRAEPNVDMTFAKWRGLPNKDGIFHQYTSFTYTPNTGERYDITAEFCEQGGYFPADVTMIQNIIADNGLGEDPDNPGGWDHFVDWRDINNVKFIDRLNLESRGLYGELPLTDSDTLSSINVCYNNLDALYVDNCTSLNDLYLSSNNGLSSLSADNTPELKYLDISSTQVSTLSDELCGQLKSLTCRETPISTLNLSDNEVLENLNCDLTNISSLDLTKATNLQGFSANCLPAFTELKLSDRSIKVQADAAQGNARLNGYDNSNGNVQIIAVPNNGYVFDGWTGLPDGYDSGNPILEVGVSEQSHLDITATFTAGDPDVGNYSLDDVRVINAMIANNNLCLEPNNPDSWGDHIDWDDGDERRIVAVHVDSSGLVGTLDVTRLSELTDITASSNRLSGVMLSGLTKLINVGLNDCGLTSLDLSGLSSLRSLNLNENSISYLDLGDCAMLEELHLNNNMSISIDVSGLQNLCFLSLHGCDLTSVNMRGHEFTTNFDEKGFAAVLEVQIDDAVQTVLLRAEPYDGNLFAGWTSTTTAIPDPLALEIRLPIPEEGNVNVQANFAENNGVYNQSDIDAVEAFVTATGWGGDIELDNPGSWGWFCRWVYNPADQTQYITELWFDSQYIGGDINFTRFTNLRSLSLTNDNATRIDLHNLAKLKTVSACDNSELTAIQLDGCPALEDLNLDRSGAETVTLSSSNNLRSITGYESKLRMISISLGAPSIALQYSSNCPADAGEYWIENYAPKQGFVEFRAEPHEGMAFAGWTGLPDMRNCMNQYQWASIEEGDSTFTVEFYANGAYYPADVAIINKLIRTNGLAELYAEDDPDSWDFVSWQWDGVARLQSLYLDDRGLTGEVDLSGCSTLGDVHLRGNDISALNVNYCYNLEWLGVSNNPLTSLTALGVSYLDELQCSYTELDSLPDSILGNLRKLQCNNTLITDLQFGDNSVLESIDCNNTPIVSIAADGTNNLNQLEISDTSALRSVLLNDRSIELSDTVQNGTMRITEYYPLDGSITLLAIPDDGYHFTGWTGLDFEDPDRLTEALLCTSIDSGIAVTVGATFAEGDPDIGNYNSGDVAAVNALIRNNNLSAQLNNPDSWGSFTNWDYRDDGTHRLSSLYMDGRNLKGDADFSTISELRQLYLGNNLLTSIDVAGLQMLSELNICNNSISQLDLSKLTELYGLDVSNNLLSTVDAYDCTLLEVLSIGSNPLTELPDISRFGYLAYYNVGGLRVPSITLYDQTFKANVSEGGMAYVNWVNLHSKEVEFETNANDGYLFAGWTAHEGITDTMAKVQRLEVPASTITTLELTANYVPEGEVTYSEADKLAVKNLFDAMGESHQINPDAPEEWGWFASWIYDSATNTRVIGDLCFDGFGMQGWIDLTAFTNLRYLYISDNPIISLDVSGLQKLNTIIANNNWQLETLNVVACTELRLISMNNTMVTVLDVSSMPYFIDIECYDSRLANFKWANGQLTLGASASGGGNAYIQYVSALSNEASICARADDNYEFARWQGAIDPSYCVTQSDPDIFIAEGEICNLLAEFAPCDSYYQHDVDVINALIADNSLDADPNDPDNWNFVNWSGSSVRMIERLNLDGASLTGDVDLSGLLVMNILYLQDNDIESLSLEGCVNLLELNVANNPSLSDVNWSGVNDLGDLWCSYTSIGSLPENVRGENLNFLRCAGTPMTSLDLKACSNILGVVCDNTPVTLLDVSGTYDRLDWIDMNGCNELKTIILCDRFIELDGETANGIINIQSYNYDSDEISLIAKPAAGYHLVEWTGLENIDVTYPVIDMTLDVSDELTVSATFTAGEPDIGDYNAADVAVINGLIDNNHLKGAKSCPDAWEFVEWTRIGDKQYIYGLYANEYGLSGNIDLTRLGELVELELGANSITGLNVANLSKLEWLVLYENDISSLDLTGLTALKVIEVDGNRIANLDVSDCTALEQLSICQMQVPIAQPDVAGLNNLYYYAVYGCGFDSATLFNRTYSVNVSPTSDCGVAEIYDINLRNKTAQFIANANAGFVFNGWTGLPEGEDTKVIVAKVNTGDTGDISLTANFIASNAEFNTNDVIAGKALIRQCGLEEDCDINKPNTWQFTDWVYDENSDTRVLVQLRLGGRANGEIDIRPFEHLRYLDVSGSGVTSVDASGLENFHVLSATYSGGLTDVNLTGCTTFRSAMLSYTSATSLDVSDSTKFDVLDCVYSPMTSLTTSGWTLDTGAVDFGNACITYVNVSANKVKIVSLPNEGYALAKWLGLPEGVDPYKVVVEMPVPSANTSIQATFISSVTISASDVTVSVGDEFMLDCLDLDRPAIAWSSSDETVATVDENGLITAVANGTATITAACATNNSISTACGITVAAGPVMKLPSLLSEISNEAFAGNTAMKRVEVGASVSSIGSGVFNGSTALKLIDLSAATTCSIASDAFSGLTDVVLLVTKPSTAYDFAKVNGQQYIYAE